MTHTWKSSMGTVRSGRERTMDTTVKGVGIMNCLVSTKGTIYSVKINCHRYMFVEFLRFMSKELCAHVNHLETLLYS